MSKSIKILLTTVVVLVLGAGLVYTGIWIGKYGLNPFANPWSTSGWGMMSGWGTGSSCQFDGSGGYGMMDGFYEPDSDADPLSLDEIEDILSAYLDDVADPDLAVSEVMIFDNHAYAQILEESTGIGAVEVLVDYQTGRVYPEHGPNMMWNLKYGHLGRGKTFRGYGMMMGAGAAQVDRDLDLDNFPEMPVSESKAAAAAQDYLDRYSPGYQADDHAVMFYGYYTLHVLDGGDVIGMLSVHGFSGQVFYHHWHGKLLETAGH